MPDLMPYNAVPGGKTSSGEILYIGRTYINGSLTPGKIQPSHKSLYIAFGGAELRFYSFEILVYK